MFPKPLINLTIQIANTVNNSSVSSRPTADLEIPLLPLQTRTHLDVHPYHARSEYLLAWQQNLITTQYND